MSETENSKPVLGTAKRKVREGVVLSDKQDKTIVVVVQRKAPHPLYKKVVKSSKKYYAHDENNDAKAGDKVRIVETRPLSKMKRWRLLEVIEKS